jgi:hypothetical protein
MDFDMKYVFGTGHDSNKFILQSKYNFIFKLSL